MKKVLSLVVGATVIFGGWILVGLGWAGVATLLRSRAEADQIQIFHSPFNSSLVDVQIAASERAVKSDPGGALGWSLLSSAYLSRSRESDDLAVAQKAEAAARKSLELRYAGNQGAVNKLIQSLLQQHRFKDALAECVKAERSRNTDDQTLRLHAECLIEIGRYVEARKQIASSPQAFTGASGDAISARLLDIEGRPAQAVILLQKATREAERASAMPGNALAWFHVRLGTQLSKLKRYEESRKEFARALELYPRDYRAMAGLAKVAFTEGQWRDAIHWGERSDQVAQMAEVRAIVGDAYAKLGEVKRAEVAYAKVIELVGRPSGFSAGMHETAPAIGSHAHRLDRQYAMFCADHNRDLDGAYAAAIRDFEAREDIYAFDTLAWVSFKRGEVVEASQAITKALQTGTKDPVILDHAAKIESALKKVAK